MIAPHWTTGSWTNSQQNRQPPSLSVQTSAFFRAARYAATQSARRGLQLDGQSSDRLVCFRRCSHFVFYCHLRFDCHRGNSRQLSFSSQPMLQVASLWTTFLQIDLVCSQSHLISQRSDCDAGLNRFLNRRLRFCGGGFSIVILGVV